jgi:hypothetical protein
LGLIELQRDHSPNPIIRTVQRHLRSESAKPGGSPEETGDRDTKKEELSLAFDALQPAPVVSVRKFSRRITDAPGQRQNTNYT